MPDGVKKGITVKVDAGLHAEVSAYIREHGMTMSEFVARALDNELHPKITEKEGNNMANTRTVAFQVPEEMFQRIKDYLQRNNMTQKQFLLGLIERELDREQSVREGENGEFERESEQDEDGNWHACYYPMADVVPKLERGLKELQEHPEMYRKYEPKNGWGTLKGAIKCIKSWLNELDGEDNWDAITNEWPIESLWWRW